VRTRLGAFAGDVDDIRIDLQGLNSLFGDRVGSAHPEEARLRLAVRTPSEGCARAVRPTRSSSCTSAPPGAAALGATPAYVPRELVTLETESVVS
jgi:hypothetical protein